MASELTVIVKDCEKTLRKKFLLYETYTVSPDDMFINACIEETLKNFDGPPEDVKVRITMSVA